MKTPLTLCAALTLAAVNCALAQQPSPPPPNAAGAPPPLTPAAASSPTPVLPPPTLAQNPTPTDAPPPVAPPGTAPAAIPAPIDPPVAAGPPGATPAVDDAGTRRPREFENTELSTVLRLLARQARINLIISDKVLAQPSTVTTRLEDVTALEAIQAIAASKSLRFVKVDNVYYVKDATEVAEPSQADYYTFSYASAPAVAALIKSQLASKADVQVDPRTNTIYYTEFKSNLDVTREFVRRLDKPTQQVMIEARLVEVNANPRQSYGINWGGVFGSATAPQTFRYGGSSFANAVPLTQPVTTFDANGVPTTTQVPLFSGGQQVQGFGQRTVTFNTNGTVRNNDFAVDASSLGRLGSLIGGQLAILSIPQMSATLRLLNEDTDAEFLANPRIVTANNLEATIKIVRKQPVPRLNFNEQTATAVFSGFEDKTYGNTLIVKPTINKDGYVTMSVKPEISNRVGDQVFTFGGATVSSPIIDTRSLESNVLIKSGCTLAIGGLLQDEIQKGRTKVPVLGDIPVLGYLFQERLNARTKRNLLVFVTPTIVQQPYGTGLESQVTGLRDSGDEFADPAGWRNNAKGAIRLIPTPNRPNAGEYPKPGLNCGPDGKPILDGKQVNYRDSARGRDR